MKLPNVEETRLSEPFLLLFQDSVTAVEFSQDGNYVATGDMAGQVQVWRTNTLQKVWDYAMGDMTVCFGFKQND